MKKQQKIGNLYKTLLIIYLFLIIVYLIENISFFILPPTGLYREKDVFQYSIKWIYATIMIIGILIIKKRPNLSWVLLNSVSVCILLQWYISFQCYTSIFDMFLLELVSLALIITTNRKSFLNTYSVERVLKARSEINK